jgi:hypothetical protein
MQFASAMAEDNKDRVSDIVVLNGSHHSDMPVGIRAHFISSGWSPLLALATLPQVLRSIQIELVEAPGPSHAPQSRDANRRLSAEGEPK